MDSGKLTGWIRTGIGYGAWIIGVLVVWRVVMSLDAVQRSGFAVEPFHTTAFPMGLPWVLFIDIAFLTVLLIILVSLGGRAREILTSALPGLPRLGDVAYLVGILLAVIVGYVAYDDLIVPPLYSQGVDWAYRLVFWLAVAGICSAIAFEVWQTVQTVTKGSSSVITLSRGSSGSPSASRQPVAVCRKCGTKLPDDAKYCSQCGARVEVVQASDKGGNDVGTS